jgi:hypothetical protein
MAGDINAQEHTFSKEGKGMRRLIRAITRHLPTAVALMVPNDVQTTPLTFRTNQ